MSSKQKPKYIYFVMPSYSVFFYSDLQVCCNDPLFLFLLPYNPPRARFTTYFCNRYLILRIVFGTLMDPPMLFASGMTYQFKAVFHVDRNIIEVPYVYHKQWAPDYPDYVVLDYNGKKHHIRVRKFSNRVYIADGLKHFRRDMRIYKGVMITFAAPDKNWKFDIHFSPPLHAQTCGRPVHSAREYVFTVDVDNRMIVKLYPLVLPLDVVGYVNAGDDYVTVLGVRGRRQFWKLSMHNGLKCFADPWLQFLTENDLMAGDEVVFYFRPNQLLWEVIARKQTVWDKDEDDSA
ncbi:hypothetical protein AAZX31_03G047000 [Glycine max]